jgi:hypothetical protein
VLGGVAICVQQQRGAFAAAWLPLAFAVLALGRPRGARLRTAVAEMAWSVAGGALVTGLVLGWAAWRASPPAVVEAIYGFARNNYAPSTAGTIAWAEVVALTRGWLAYTWLPLLRIAPLFLLLDGISIVRVLAGARARADLVNAAIWLLATVMALSIWYLPDFIHVSFVLPFLLLPAARLVHALRTWRGWSGVPAVSRTLAAAVAVAGLAVVVKAGANLARIHASAPRTFDTAFGRLRGDAAMEALFRAVRDHAVPERDGRRLLFSYPDDAWLYLTLPADDPMRFSVLVPGFFPAEDVAEAVAVIEARRPGTIVLLAAFADDPVGRAVRARYRPVAELPPYRIFVRPDAD